jgi:penicillin-binding protein A
MAVNRPIVRLYGLVVLLFALLVAFTSRWTIFEASSLRSNPLNKRALLQQERIARGRILAADGTVLAHSVPGTGGTYQRSYPKGEEFAHAIGFSYINPDLGQTGLEHFRNAALNGQTGTNLQTILDQLQGKRPQGDEVLTTLDPKAQQAAITALGEHHGARMKSSLPTRRVGRWSTVPPSSAMHRARPSRSSQQPRRSTRDSSLLSRR